MLQTSSCITLTELSFSSGSRDAVQKNVEQRKDVILISMLHPLAQSVWLTNNSLERRKNIRKSGACSVHNPRGSFGRL